jgi:hypothetical protein
MQHNNFRKAHSCPQSQEIPQVYVKLFVPPPRSQKLANVPILRQKNPVHALQAHFVNSHFNISFPPKPRSSK